MAAENESICEEGTLVVVDEVSSSFSKLCRSQSFVDDLDGGQKLVDDLGCLVGTEYPN